MRVDASKIKKNEWKLICGNEDAEKFLSGCMYFHDSVITEIVYTPNPEPYQRSDGRFCANTSLKITYNVYTNMNKSAEQNTDEVPVRKSIEVDFRRVRKFHFVPFDEGDCNILSQANIVFMGECLIWGELPGAYDKKNEYGFTDKKTWILCEEIRWREMDRTVLW